MCFRFARPRSLVVDGSCDMPPHHLPLVNDQAGRNAMHKRRCTSIGAMHFMRRPSISLQSSHAPVCNSKWYVLPICVVTTRQHPAAKKRRVNSHAGLQAAATDVQQLDPPAALQHYRVVLVSPKTPANIGSCMRLCDNFEAYDLCVVAPRCDVFGEEVSVVSRQSRLLQLVSVEDTLAAALAPCGNSIGFTRRTGGRRPVYNNLVHLERTFADALPSIQGAPLPTALVFGREESGLTAEETEICSLLCSLPTGRLQPSLNLSHAIAVVLSQLFQRQAFPADHHVQGGSAREPAGGYEPLQPQPLGGPTTGAGAAGIRDLEGAPARSASGTAAFTSNGEAIPSAGFPLDRGEGNAAGPADSAEEAIQAAAAGGGGNVGLYSRARVAGRVFEVGELRAQRALESVASQGEVEKLLERLQLLAVDVGMEPGGQESSAGVRSRRVVQLMRGLMSRGKITTQEARLLHSLITAVNQQLAR